MEFRYLEDKKYFADILCGGDIVRLENEYKDYFDFRPASIKRKEFNFKIKKLFPIVFKRAKGICQICNIAKGKEVDHIIPIASNQLNKKFRKMKPIIANGNFKKVLAENYGSNNLINLQLVCKSCNRKKWHNF